MSLAVTNVFASGETLSHSKMNTNFDDVETAVFSIGNANMDEESPISKEKIADRFVLVEDTMIVLPIMSGADLAVITLYNMVPGSTSDVEVMAKKVKIATGEKAYLAAVTVHAIDVELNSGSSYPALTVKKNGTDVGGGALVMDDGDGVHYELSNGASFESAPLSALQEDDILSIELGTDGATADVSQMRGLTVCFVYKRELIAA